MYRKVKNGSMTCDRFVVRSCRDATEWDAFVDCISWATPQHAFIWGKTLENCFGYLQQTYRLFFVKDRAVAGLPLIRLSAGWPFRALYSLVFGSYGGPLIHPEHLDDRDLFRTISAEVDSEAVRYGAFEARLIIPASAPEAIIQGLHGDDGATRFRRSCPLLALDRPFDQVVRGYSPSIRRAVRRSAREGVLIEENVEIERVRQAYPIYRKTMDRIGGSAKPWRFLEALLREKLAVPFLAQRDGILVGVVILLVSRQMATYWVSAADPAASTWRPTNALVDHAIRWCHSRGIPLFNFGESYRERPGLVRFKEEWGARPAESTVVIRIYRPRIQRIWCALEPVARRTYAMWDQWKTGIS
jgi:hypothetical protein